MAFLAGNMQRRDTCKLSRFWGNIDICPEVYQNFCYFHITFMTGAVQLRIAMMIECIYPGAGFDEKFGDFEMTAIDRCHQGRLAVVSGEIDDGALGDELFDFVEIAAGRRIE